MALKSLVASVSPPPPPPQTPSPNPPKPQNHKTIQTKTHCLPPRFCCRVSPSLLTRTSNLVADAAPDLCHKHYIGDREREILETCACSCNTPPHTCIRPHWLMAPALVSSLDLHGLSIVALRTHGAAKSSLCFFAILFCLPRANPVFTFCDEVSRP